MNFKKVYIKKIRKQNSDLLNKLKKYLEDCKYDNIEDIIDELVFGMAKK